MALEPIHWRMVLVLHISFVMHALKVKSSLQSILWGEGQITKGSEM